MNILQMTLAFPPCYAWGGPVKTTYQSCRELVRRGYHVTVYCSNLVDKNRKIFPHTTVKELDGVRVVYFNALNISSWPGTLGPVWLPELKEYIKRELHEFDVVHMNGYRNIMHLPLSKAAFNRGIPYIIQPHGTLPVVVNSFLVKRIYDRFLGRRDLAGVSGLVALQQSEVDQALAHGVAGERIHIIPNGLNAQDRDTLPEKGRFRRKHAIAAEKKIILFAARINPKKGTDMLVEAFARMQGKHDLTLVIAGPDDGQLAEVQGLIRRFGLKNHVLFTGLLSHREVLEAFVDADIFVLPCRTDTFPMAMVEACLTQTPMVVTDRCEIAHLVKNRVAEVVPFCAESFAQAMQRLVVDQQLYNAYKSACPETLETVFSLRNAVDKLEALYQQVISEARNVRKSA